MSAPHSEVEVEQEDDVIAGRPVSIVLLATVVVSVVAVGISTALLAARRATLDVHEAPAATVAPRQIDGIHQTLIERDRHGWELREEQRRSLERYRWIDREHGVAQIPIDAAMEIVVQRAKANGGAP